MPKLTSARSNRSNVSTPVPRTRKRTRRAAKLARKRNR